MRDRKRIQQEKLQLGVCYYPEHWPKSLWEDDFRRMRQMNISVIRVAEFAWSIFEPTEGDFQFGFFDEVLDLAHQHGLQVILGTPTATPPAWLTQKYPEVLNVSQSGVQYQHGQRRHYNYSTPIYRELCARITRKMAEHYKDHPVVIGWQIDNELNCETNVFYAEADHRSFRAWVQEKYGNLDRLNAAWGTVFWSQTYTDWEQVHLTRPTVSDSPNPHQALDEKRWISDNTISFAQLQSDILRELCPKHWVTTNGTFGHLDNHRLADEALDFFSYDSYPQFSTLWKGEDERPLQDRNWSFNLSNTRSISPNFCVMEQQSGPGGWVNRIEMASPRPGQVRLWSYQSILHGTDLLVYFRWRTATVGTEIYWHGINDYHNQPNRRVREVGQVGEELARIGEAVAGSTYKANVAILRDYDNQWDGELDVWHGPLTHQSNYAWFKQLQYGHIPADVLYMHSHTTIDELLAYELIIYPHAAIMTEATAAILTAYVEQGGKLVFGARTGYKNEHGHCYMRPFPGVVGELCGISIEDYTLIKGTVPAAQIQWEGTTGTGEAQTVLFNEVLQVEDPAVEVVATYTSEYYAGKPALTRRAVGKGEVWYYGAAFTEPVVDEVIRRSGVTSPAADWAVLPAQVELGIRSSAAADYVFLLNYGADAVTVEWKPSSRELLSGGLLQGTVELEPYAVRIIEMKKL